MNERTRELAAAAPAVIAVATLGVVALLGLFGYGTLAGAAAILGWLLLTPLSAVLVDALGLEEPAEETDEPESATAADPLETLRDRYARGEIGEAEFERRLERLLETEDVELPPGATLPADETDPVPGAEGTERDATRERERESARER
jgi:uncharacterized membrane protein